MDESFETSSLTVRRFQRSDLDALVAARSDPEVARYQDWATFTELDGWAINSAIRSNLGEPGWFQFALERKKDRAFVGDCGLGISEADNRQAHIGYTITRTLWGHGYATEAARGLVEFAFRSVRIHRIVASVDPRNVGSVRVLEKAGFKKEAHGHKSKWFKGEWADDTVYAVLSKEGSA